MEVAMVRAAVVGLVVMAALSSLPAQAADVYVDRPAVVKAAPPPVIVATPPVEPDGTVLATPIKPEPEIHYGCQRIWRCDNVVCEWRRGCWGVYGYMEGPYYTLDLARRQWENHGWPTSSRRRLRVDK
jgi:hypothetical protein